MALCFIKLYLGQSMTSYCDYDATGANEISLREGTEVIVTKLGEDEGWIKARRVEDGKEGQLTHFIPPRKPRAPQPMGAQQMAAAEPRAYTEDELREKIGQMRASGGVRFSEISCASSNGTLFRRICRVLGQGQSLALSPGASAL
mmetsp:Transcript_66199/g.163007  ORF Transcript_66199/g.163007 Transcript_66199/m.163007 type:complete len:145 (-) Transcript_66199:168-602(-)